MNNKSQRGSGGVSYRGPQLWTGFWNTQRLLLSAIVFVVIGDLSICFLALDLPHGTCVSHALKEDGQCITRTHPVRYIAKSAEMWMIVVSIGNVIIADNVFRFHM